MTWTVTDALADATRGASVLWVESTHMAARAALDDAAAEASRDMLVRRTNGREAVLHPSGGQVLFLSSAAGLRGLSASVVYAPPRVMRSIPDGADVVLAMATADRPVIKVTGGH